MNSALSPREIQARVRAGATLDEVASEAGVPPEKVEPFASPVFAERAHVAGTAQQSPVRRAGEPGPHPMLRQVVAPVFARLGVPADSLAWDAWRNDDRRWTIRVTWPESTSEGDLNASADFLFDQNSRFSIAANQAARDLIGERPTPIPEVATDPDNEPTIDLDDELALVRATQPPMKLGRRPRVVPDVPVATFDAPADNTSVAPVDLEFSEVDIVEVDGVYDFVPGSSQLDMLYDMLSGINEDSVNIYEDLQPIPPVESNDGQSEDTVTAPNPTTSMPPATGMANLSILSSSSLPIAPLIEPAGSTQAAEPQPEPPTSPAEAKRDPLVELSTPIPTRPRNKRGHAAVPSWDEILFGSPTQKPDKN